ncbi:multicopper oxidase family protein [Variovorax saccharolyticus]|uniref:multicopper oxidase family protein n=1 Tax=Variovorax saccharolyticus TaxID=3053516 RepID=UPI00257748A8|nr:multicopper oxidase domain-containing protein [Variovorax sp. J31P216]MDM0024033.1 multicopper oxidase domain-containing protein [Variovorax sp. J31P216]
MEKQPARNESAPPGFRDGRRTLLKASVAAAAAAPMVLTPRKTEAQVVVLPPSPPTAQWAWMEELPLVDTPLLATTLTPAPTLAANLAAGECGRASHQRFAELTATPPQMYQLTAKENPLWRYTHADNAYYPAQPVWGYEGNSSGVVSMPGPTIHARYGTPVILRIRNELPPLHSGFGSPEISTHLHNMHTPSESDGYAGDFYSPQQQGPTLTAPGSFNDHFYPNVYAGLDEFAPGSPIGDSREALGSLFYHDHTEGVTAPNVLKGLLGRYNIYDALDTGNETTGLRLPSGPYDYNLTFADKRFDSGGRLFFDELNPEGVLGDKTVVNGKIEPTLRVARRKYRFRLLSAGPSRFYEFYLQNAGRTTIYTYTIISSDGNLLPNPLINQFRVRLAPAERADIVIDFSRFPLGTTLYLVNQLVQIETRQPTAAQAPGTQVLKFIVDRNPSEPDTTPVLTASTPLRPLRTLTAAELAGPTVRSWNFERSSGMWSVNGQFFNVLTARATITKGATEIWEFINNDNGWQHPIHVHFEEGRILSKFQNGVSVPIPPIERGRKDVFVLGPNSSMRVLFRFRDFTGKYLMHCHNLTHEDHAMMVRYDIV